MSNEKEENEESPLQLTEGDHIRTGIRAILSAIPFAGGPLEILFSRYSPSPIDRRRDKFLMSINSGLKELQEKLKSFDLESLAKNATFITALLQAWQIAIRNHQKEKLDALRNAVLNTALISKPDDDEILVFLNYIDSLTPWHLRLLKFFDDPKRWGEQNKISYPNWIGGGSSAVLEHTFPELVDRRDFYHLVVNDLYNRGLMGSDARVLNVQMSSDGMFASRTTDRGKQFLKFITSPIPGLG